MIRAAALRSPWRSVCPRQSKAGWTIEITRFIHTEQLPPVLDSKPCPPDRDPSPPQKGFFVRMYERYSFQKEKERWIQAESFFQSLSHQAHDAYVIPVVIAGGILHLMLNYAVISLCRLLTDDGLGQVLFLATSVRSMPS